MTYRDWREYQVDIPAGQHGNAKIEKVVVSEADAKWSDLRCLFSSGGANIGRGVTVGQHTELYVGHCLWMSDTRAEVMDHSSLFATVTREVVVHKTCDVLIHGLGLGMALNGCLLDGATHVTVVDVDPDVIALVAPHWLERWGSDRIEIIQADALTWKPAKGKVWDVVWHDIWASITSDNLATMGVLHRRFARRSRWQGSWCRRRCQEARRREQAEERRYRYGW